jgi:hypothetical protein
MKNRNTLGATLITIALLAFTVQAQNQPAAATAATPEVASKPSAATETKPTPSVSAETGSTVRPSTATTAKDVLPLAPEKSSPITIPRFEKAPTIDGKLDDDVWKQAVVLRDFYQIQPGDNVPPSKPTEVLLGFDSQFLYIAFKATDEPDKGTCDCCQARQHFSGRLRRFHARYFQ